MPKKRKQLVPLPEGLILAQVRLLIRGECYFLTAEEADRVDCIRQENPDNWEDIVLSKLF
ncbi:MAG: hypothetical protein WBB28_01775 [Crinalium sp.]